MSRWISLKATPRVSRAPIQFLGLSRGAKRRAAGARAQHRLLHPGLSHTGWTNVVANASCELKEISEQTLLNKKRASGRSRDIADVATLAAMVAKKNGTASAS